MLRRLIFIKFLDFLLKYSSSFFRMVLIMKMMKANPVVLFEFDKVKRTGSICGVQTYNYFFMKIQKDKFIPLFLIPGMFFGDCSKYYNKLFDRYVKYLFDYSKHIKSVNLVFPGVSVYSKDFMLIGMLVPKGKPIKFNGNSFVSKIVNSVVENVSSKIFSVLFYPGDYMEETLKLYFENYIELLKLYVDNPAHVVRVSIGHSMFFVDVFEPTDENYSLKKFKMIDDAVLKSYFSSNYPVTELKLNSYSWFKITRLDRDLFLCFTDNCVKLHSLNVKRVKIVNVDKGSDFLSGLIKAFHNAYVRLNGGVDIKEFLKDGCFPVIKQVRVNDRIYALTVMVKPDEVVEYDCRALSKKVVVNVDDLDDRFVILSVPGKYTNFEEVIGSDLNTSGYIIFSKSS